MFSDLYINPTHWIETLGSFFITSFALSEWMCVGMGIFCYKMLTQSASEYFSNSFRVYHFLYKINF